MNSFEHGAIYQSVTTEGTKIKYTFISLRLASFMHQSLKGKFSTIWKTPYANFSSPIIFNESNFMCIFIGYDGLILIVYLPGVKLNFNNATRL